MSVEQQVIEILETVLKHQAMPEQDISADKALYDDGLGLDSLCVAELSALLEKTFKSDPYTQGVMPETVADIITFYGEGAA